MLHYVIILTGAGVALFEKIWVTSGAKLADKGRLFGSLITTMQEFARQSTGLFVSYVEFDKSKFSKRVRENEQENQLTL